MLIAIGTMLPVIVRPMRVVMRRLIAIMALGVVLEIRANACYAGSRTYGPVDHRQSEQHDDDLRARWSNNDHEAEYSTPTLRSIRLRRNVHSRFTEPFPYETDAECGAETLSEGAAIRPRP
jgi:hypothetical protein